jgi:hypothetical protein
MSDAFSDIARNRYWDGEPEEMTNAEYLKHVAEFTIWRIKQTGGP